MYPEIEPVNPIQYEQKFMSWLKLPDVETLSSEKADQVVFLLYPFDKPGELIEHIYKLTEDKIYKDPEKALQIIDGALHQANNEFVDIERQAVRAHLLHIHSLAYAGLADQNEDYSLIKHANLSEMLSHLTLGFTDVAKRIAVGEYFVLDGDSERFTTLLGIYPELRNSTFVTSYMAHSLTKPDLLYTLGTHYNPRLARFQKPFAFSDN